MSVFRLSRSVCSFCRLLQAAFWRRVMVSSSRLSCCRRSLALCRAASARRRAFSFCCSSCWARPMACCTLSSRSLSFSACAAAQAKTAASSRRRKRFFMAGDWSGKAAIITAGAGSLKSGGGYFSGCLYAEGREQSSLKAGLAFSGCLASGITAGIATPAAGLRESVGESLGRSL